MQSHVLRRALALAGLLLVAAVAAAPDRAAAQEADDPPSVDTPYRWIDGSFRVGLYGGLLETNRANLEIGPASTAIFGGRTRVRLTGPISLEGNLGFADSERAVVDPTLPGGPAAVDTVPFQWAVVEAGFHVALTGQRTWHRLQPYFLIGGGMIIGVDEPRSPALDGVAGGDADLRFQLNTAPTAMAGLGTEWRVSERIGIGFEVRDHLWRLTTPDGFFREEILREIEQAGTEAPDETQWVNNPEFGISLWYYF